MPSDNRQELHFEQRNTAGKETILFMHGAGSCSLEWDLVAKDGSLASYHLILVDLPQHSGSHQIAPFTLTTAADAVADTITNYAHYGRAHVVGMSLGGFTALDLTARHPQVVLSCFVSGAMPWQGLYKWFGERPNLIWWVGRLQSAIPGLDKLAEKAQGLQISPELRAELNRNHSKDLLVAAFHAITTQFDWNTVQAVAASGIRTCIVAGSKSDQVDGVRKMGPILREEGKKRSITNNVVEVKDAVHWWNIQLPTLFAQGVSAWASATRLPQEFVEL